MGLFSSHKPFKHISLLWLLAEDVIEIQSVRRTLYTIIALKMVGPTFEGMQWPRGADSDIWLIYSKETEISDLNPKEVDSAN